jgi:hypothetical protein
MKCMSAAALAAAILLATPLEAGAWEDLGAPPNGMTSEPDCITRGSNLIDCFVRGGDAGIWTRRFAVSRWSAWQPLPTGVTRGRPECVSWAANRMDCFSRDTAAAMLHWWWDGSAWRGPENLGGALASDISCTTWGVNRIDCFARGGGAVMYHRWWNGSSWGGWEPLQGVTLGTITFEPDCNSWAAGRIDCFARGTDQLLYHTWWGDGPSWGMWERLGGGSVFEAMKIDSKPSCTTWGTNRLDCFVRTRVGMRHVSWNGSSWGLWQDLGGPLAGGLIRGDPSCVSRAVSRIDCFARGADNAIWRRQWNGARWVAWERLGGSFTTSPHCISWGAARIDCFIRSRENRLMHRWWNGSSWLPAI